MRFSITEPLLQQLRAFRAQRLARTEFPYEFESEDDTFLLDPGMGPATFLTARGVVFIDKDEFWGEPKLREATDDEAVASIVVGAEKTGVIGLLALVPPRPPGAINCPRCLGERWMQFGTDIATGEPGRIVCIDCSGRGWRCGT